MSELEIPDRATTCFWESTFEVDMDPSDWDVMENGLALAACIIVVSEFRKTAASWKRAGLVSPSAWMWLEARAHELDPEGPTQ